MARPADQNPATLTLENAILDAVKGAAAPLKAAQILKLVKPSAGRDATPKNAAAPLDTLMSSGLLRRIGAGAANGSANTSAPFSAVSTHLNKCTAGGPPSPATNKSGYVPPNGRACPSS